MQAILNVWTFLNFSEQPYQSAAKKLKTTHLKRLSWKSLSLKCWIVIRNVSGERQNPPRHQWEHQQQSGHVVILRGAGPGGHDPRPDLLPQEVLWGAPRGLVRSQWLLSALWRYWFCKIKLKTFRTEKWFYLPFCHESEEQIFSMGDYHTSHRAVKSIAIDDLKILYVDELWDISNSKF